MLIVSVAFILVDFVVMTMVTLMSLSARCRARRVVRLPHAGSGLLLRAPGLPEDSKPQVMRKVVVQEHS